MKNSVKNIFAGVICTLAFFSCEKEEDRAILQVGNAPSLTVSESVLVLTEEEADAEAINFSWTPADYGYDAAIQYSLQFGLAGNDFADAREIAVGTAMDTTFSVERLNTVAIQLGLEPDVAHDLEMRVKSQVYDPAGVAATVMPLNSDPFALTITPYSSMVEPAYVYAPGAYQGWDPGTAAAFASVEDDGLYQGFISFPDAESLEFKITAERSWDENWGADEEGNLVADGPNLTVPEPGSYLIEVDMNSMSWSATPYSWGVIGDATGSWDQDQDMVYDHEAGVWTLTTELSEGSLKFRLNDDWATNYGLQNEGDENLTLDGQTNIPVTEAGTYTITLDLRDEEKPTYSIDK